jgi:hypothetical protein
MTKDGGMSGINRYNFKYSTLPPILNFFKGAQPFKQQKTCLSGYTTI